MSRGGRGPEAIRSSGFNSSARVNAVVITVLIGSSEPGVWVIKTAQTIPNSELWLHQPAASARLDRALLAMSEPPRAAKCRQTFRTFALHQSPQGLLEQGTAFQVAAELLGPGQQLIVKRHGGAHERQH